MSMSPSLTAHDCAVASLQVVAAQTAIIEVLLFITEGIGCKADAVVALQEAYENLNGVLKSLEVKP